MRREAAKDTGETQETPRQSPARSGAGKTPSPLGNPQQVRGTRPLRTKITAQRGIFLHLLNSKTPAPATRAPVQIKPGGRNLWFRPSLRKQLKHHLPHRPGLPPLHHQSRPLRPKAQLYRRRHLSRNFLLLLPARRFPLGGAPQLPRNNSLAPSRPR